MPQVLTTTQQIDRGLVNSLTPCIANTAAMSLPLLAADDDSEVTVAAKGYSPPTPAPECSSV